MGEQMEPLNLFTPFFQGPRERTLCSQGSWAAARQGDPWVAVGDLGGAGRWASWPASPLEAPGLYRRAL